MPSLPQMLGIFRLRAFGGANDSDVTTAAPTSWASATT